MPKLRALVVDDTAEMAQTIAVDLEKAGFEAEIAGDGTSALEKFLKEPTDVVVTDLRMKGSDGLDLLAGIKQAEPTTPVIIMTAFGAVESAVEAMRRGAYHYVTKPFALETLRVLVERACRERALSRENALLRRTLRSNLSSRQLLGNSLPMRQLRALIAQISDATSSVLISGETGTGKELVALAVHTSGPRADRSFVAVNCAALPENLLESELFGHARGAFTGAATTRRGLFVEADGGTMFLDEIGDLPAALQGEAAAGAAIGRGPSGRVGNHAHGRRPLHRRNTQGSLGARREGTVSGGSVLQARRPQGAGPASTRAERGRSTPGRSLP